MGWFGVVSLCSMPCWRQSLSNRRMLNRAMGPERYRGGWRNWMPLSVSTVDVIRRRLDDGVRERHGVLPVGGYRQAYATTNLRGSVGGNEQMELSLARADPAMLT